MSIIHTIWHKGTEQGSKKTELEVLRYEKEDALFDEVLMLNKRTGHKEVWYFPRYKYINSKVFTPGQTKSTIEVNTEESTWPNWMAGLKAKYNKQDKEQKEFWEFD